MSDEMNQPMSEDIELPAPMGRKTVELPEPGVLYEAIITDVQGKRHELYGDGVQVTFVLPDLEGGEGEEGWSTRWTVPPQAGVKNKTARLFEAAEAITEDEDGEEVFDFTDLIDCHVGLLFREEEMKDGGTRIRIDNVAKAPSAAKKGKKARK